MKVAKNVTLRVEKQTKTTQGKIGEPAATASSRRPASPIQELVLPGSDPATIRAAYSTFACETCHRITEKTNIRKGREKALQRDFPRWAANSSIADRVVQQAE